MTLRKKYKRYAEGGGLDTSNLMGAAAGSNPYAAAIAMGQQLLTSAVDEFAPTNEFGHQSAIAQGIKGNLQLGTIGGVMGYMKGRKQMKEDKTRRFHNELNLQQGQLKRSAAAISADPALITGKPGEELYASGGFLKNKYNLTKATGGNLKPMSVNSAEVQGPSHEQGGVDLPQYQSELEGKESVQDDYVFSDRLGFAQIHKKLARAIGKIEQKPATPERINSLRRMNGQIEQLKEQQEQIRQQYN